MVEELKANLARIIFEPLSRLGFSHKTQASALWSLIESLSSPFFSLLLLPVLTYSLGLGDYGLYVMVMALVSFFGFTGLGMNTSIIYFLAVNYQKSNHKQIAERLSTALLITLLGTLVFSCLFFLALNAFEAQLEKQYPQLIDKQQLIYIALGLVVLTQLDMVVLSAIKGLQQFKTSSKVEFSLRFLNFIVMTLVAVTQKSVEAIVLVVLVMTMLNLMMRYAVLNKIVSINIYNIRINRQSIYELFHYGKWMTLQNLSGAIFGSLDKLVIGSFLGNTVLGSYNILLSISQLVHFIPANMLTFVMPRVATSSQGISIGTLKRVLIITATLSVIFSTLMYTCRELIFSHLHVDISYENLFFWLIFSYFLLSLNAPIYFIALGMNLAKEVSLQCIIGSIVGIILMLMLISSNGLMAVLVSKLVYSFFAIFLIIPVLRKIK